MGNSKTDESKLMMLNETKKRESRLAELEDKINDMTELCSQLEREKVIEIVSNLRHLFTTIDRGIIRKTKQQELDYEEQAEKVSNSKDSGVNDHMTSSFGLDPIGAFEQTNNTSNSDSDYQNKESSQEPKKVPDEILEKEWQPMLNSLQNVVPLIEKVALIFAKDDDVLSNACTLFERLSKNLDQFFKQILEKIVPTLNQVFEINPHGSIINLCEYTSLIFFEEPAAQNLLLNICKTFTEKFEETNNLNIDFMDIYSPVFIEFTNTLGIIMRKRFQIFTAVLSIKNKNDGQVALILFEMLLQGLSNKQNDAVLIRTSSYFLVDYWKMAATKNPDCKNLGTHFLNKTISIILQAFFGQEIGGGDENILCYFSDILFQISKTAFPEFNNSFKEGFEVFFQASNLENLKMNKRHFETKVRLIVKERSNRNRFREHCKEWLLLSKNLVSPSAE